MPVFLLDINVLLALLWPSVEAHSRAQEWFDAYASDGWATCPFTQAAFIRLVSNPSFSREALTPLDAESLLSSNLNHPGHRFWPDALSVPDAIAPLRGGVVGHRRITDAYLLGLALFRKGKLATFDRAIISLLREDVASRSTVELIQR